MNKKAVTVTILANMTSNYGETLGNAASVQKVYRKGKTFAMRSRESLKNSIMVQGGMYEDLKVSVDGATQKAVSADMNAATCRALEGGYMNTSDVTHIRKSSIYLTDAIACESFVNETRFHNNLYLASTYAKQNNLNVQKDAGACGLMPYQYEYDKTLKAYSLTIDLEMVGKDENFADQEASAQEKAQRVNDILSAVEHLSLVVKGNLDNAEPIFVVGGLCERKTHYFENLVNVKADSLVITVDLKERVEQGYRVGLLEGGNLNNELEIKEKLKAISVTKFFAELRQDVNKYYGV